jgi:hypothetical protein
VAKRVAQVNDERVDIVGEASRGRRIAGPLELGDESLKPSRSSVASSSAVQ